MGQGFRPIISKIRCENPNKVRTKIRNYNYLHYIATREGTDLTNIDERNLEIETLDLNQSEEDLLAKESTNDSYLKYIAKRPKSHGLFGNIDTENFTEISKKLNEESKKNKVVYRGVISLSEVDAQALGFLEKQKWSDYLNEVMPDIAKELGVSSTNCTWVAAYHAEPSHPHVHYMLWDNRDKIKSSFIHPSVQKKCRQICQDAMFTEENERIIREITKAEREEVYKIRNASREKIIDYFKEVFNNKDLVAGEVKEILPSRLSKEDYNKFRELYKQALETLPRKGRCSYQFMPPECKEKLNQISKLFYNKEDIKKQYYEYLETVRKSQELIGKTKAEIKKAISKAESDILNRTGNIVLKGIMQLKDELLEEKISQDKVDTFPETEEWFEERTLADEIDALTEVEEYFEYFTKKENLFEEKGDLKKKFYFNKKEKKEALDFYYNDESNIPEQEKFNLLKKYAEKGNIFCLEQIASLMKEEKENSDIYYKKAVEGIQQIIEKYKANEDVNEKAKFTYSYANYQMGLYYYKGLGVEKDICIAENYFLKANSVNANYLLGKIYNNKDSSLYNTQKAIQYYEKSLNSISSNEKIPFVAYFSLAQIYKNKKLDVYNARKAEEYFQKLLVNLKDKEQVNKYIQKLVNHSKIELGRLYLDKNSEVYNLDKAFEILSSYSYNTEKDFAEVLFNLGKIYSTQEFDRYDMEKAMDYFKGSAEKGNSYAMYKLGIFNYYGIGVDKNKNLGKEWLQKSANLGNEQAQGTLKKIESTSFDKYTYTLLREILSFMGNQNRKSKMMLQEKDFKHQSKQLKREEYLHHN